MKKFDALRPDPTKIGTIAEPPFARLPDPKRHFETRAARFRALSEGHDLAPYLTFLGDLAAAQAVACDTDPAPRTPAEDAMARSADHAMPPLDRARFSGDAAFDAIFETIMARMSEADMPPAARDALIRLGGLPAEFRASMVGNVLADAVPMDAIAEHAFVAAAVQVHYARLAAQLDVDALTAIGDGVCPACGGAPAASVVVGWQNAEGTRFCACSTCQTLWHYVRAKCTLCGSTDDIAFQEVESLGWNVKAETCGTCRGYVKVMYQDKEARLDPLADDVATLGLDLLVKELGFRRGAVNTFLTGY